MDRRDKRDEPEPSRPAEEHEAPLRDIPPHAEISVYGSGETPREPEDEPTDRAVRQLRRLYAAIDGAR
jgi:hypothetical protein